MSIKEIWERRNDKLVKEMEEYAKNYECRKCNEDYCDHMLRARTRKFGKKVERQIDELMEISGSKTT